MMPLGPDYQFGGLKGKHITLRKIKPSDSRLICDCFAGQSTIDLQPLPCQPRGREVREMIEHQKQSCPDTPGIDYFFGIEQTGRSRPLLGLCRAMTDKSDPCQVKIRFYFPVKSRTGNRVAELILMLVEYYFYERNKNKIRVLSDVRDEEFNNYLLAGGFSSEGRLRENSLKYGRWCDEYLFALLRKEWSQEFPFSH